MIILLLTKFQATKFLNLLRQFSAFTSINRVQ